MTFLQLCSLIFTVTIANTCTPAIAISTTIPASNPAKSQSETVLSGSLENSQTETYLIYGQARQNLTITLTSERLNAVFTLTGPDGRIIAQRTNRWIGSLTTTGNYRLTISSTGGIANYTVRYNLR
jgi:hypothetical protein